MSRLLKRVRIGKYAVPILLLATLAIGTVAAVSYVIITFTMTLSLGDYPRVHFYDGTSVEANTMTISMNIFKNVKTIDEDVAWDIRSDGAGDIKILVTDMDENEVASVTIIAYTTADGPDNFLFSETFTSAETDWSTATVHTTDADDYNLWIEVTGASTAATTGTTSITVELKVEEP